MLIDELQLFEKLANSNIHIQFELYLVHPSPNFQEIIEVLSYKIVKYQIDEVLVHLERSLYLHSMHFELIYHTNS